MNNDLEQFSEERLKDIIELADNPTMTALARIALSVKQAKPMEVLQFIINNPEKDGYIEWADCNQDYFNSISTDYRRVLYTTPQPAHKEQVIPEGLTETKLIKASAWIKGLRQQNPHMNEAKTCEEFINQLLASINISKAAAPKPESE